MITLPELPDGYRWKYFYSHFDSTSKLRLQKRICGFWIHQDSHYLHIGTYDNEQDKLTSAANYMLDSLNRKLETRHGRSYGIYRGGDR